MGGGRRHLWVAIVAVATVIGSMTCSTTVASAGGDPSGGWVATPVAPILEPGPPPASEDAGNFHENAEHNGIAPGPALDPTHLRLLWSASLAGSPGYPIVANGEVFVSQLVGLAEFQVLAFDARTGRLRWKSDVIAGQGTSYNSLSYANGRLFSVGYHNGVIAFDARSGQVDWQIVTDRTDCDTVTGVSSTAHGLLWVPFTCHDVVGAYDQSTGAGAPAGAGPTNDMTQSGPAITSDSVYTVSTCHDVERWTLDGRLVWSRNDGCHGGGSVTATVHGSQVWARDILPASQDGEVISTVDGHLIGHFVGNAAPPAFDGSTAITLSAPPGAPPALVALDASLRTKWTQSGDGVLTSAPLVSGHVAYVGSGTGHLYGYSTVTGEQVWQAFPGVAVGGTDSTYFGVAGLTIGDGLLAAPGGTSLFVYGEVTGTPATTNRGSAALLDRHAGDLEVTGVDGRDGRTGQLIGVRLVGDPRTAREREGQVDVVDVLVSVGRRIQRVGRALG